MHLWQSHRHSPSMEKFWSICEQFGSLTGKSPHVWQQNWCTSALNLAYHDIFTNIFWNLPSDLRSEKYSVTESIIWQSVKYSGLLFSVAFLCSCVNIKVSRCKGLVSVIHYSCWCAWAGSDYWGVLSRQWCDLPRHSFLYSHGKEVSSLELNVTAPTQ